MGRIPLIALSSVGAIVLFVGTSVGLLAAQGKLGAAMGKEPAAEGTEGTEGAGAEGSKGASGADHVDPAAAAGSAGASTGPADPAAAGSAHEAEATPVSKASVLPAAGPAKKPASADVGGATGAAAGSHGTGASPDPAETRPPLPPRGATETLAKRFTLPAPLTPQELDELVQSLRRSRDEYARVLADVADERASNERERLSLDARAAELADLRTRLDEEKASVLEKVAEMSTRIRELEAGEERFVVMYTKMLKELAVDEMKERLVLLDDRLAAQVLAKLPARTAGQLLGALEATRQVSITKALQQVAASAASTQGAADQK